MPVQIFNKTYTDIFGNSLGFYRMNAGDKVKLALTLRATIRFSSLTNPLFLDAITNQITSSSQSWIEEGFRPGDNVTCNVYDVSSTSIYSWTTSVLYVDDSIIQLSSIPYWYDNTAQQFFVVYATYRMRSTLEASLNHVLNSTAGMPFSLIDGESTRMKFEGTDILAVGSTITGLEIVNKSGQYLTSSELTRQADNVLEDGSLERSFLLELEYLQSGIRNPDWFFTAECLKTYLKLEWASLADEPFAKSISLLNESGNTGYFDQPYNTGVVDAVLVQGVTVLDWSSPTTFDVIVDSASIDYAIGAAYQSINVDYYKNRPYSQGEISMVLGSTVPTVSTAYTSLTNEFGANYTLELDSITTVGTINTLKITFTPNASFTTFFDGLEDGDRLFKLWVKFGNLNLLVFNDQLSKSPPVGGPLIPVQNIFIDHSDNTTESVDSALSYEANTEDDLAFCGKFLLEKGASYDSIEYRIVAYNPTTLESFDLNTCFFNISTIPFVGGQYIINQSNTVQNTLPTTSNKRIATLVLEPTIDTLTEYGIKVYFPFLLRWEYWLQQLNADADFYPNEQTKNWFNFNNLGDWELRLNIELVKDGLAYIFEDTVIDKDYDSEPLIVQNIELYIDATNTNVGIVTEGQLMRVIATHSLISGEVWDDAVTWGMITVEPTESNPRFISSTVIDYDNNPSNPLIPLVGETKCKLTFPTPTLAKMECFFNPDLINLSNGVKFTTKIKGCSLESPMFKITTTDLDKLTTDDNNKIIA
jgi:hypothetical protein